MEEEGRVIKVEGNFAQVEIEKKSTCRACGLCSMRGKNTMIAEAENTIGAKVGERVRIEIPSSVILKGAFLFFYIPLMALISGILLEIKVTNLPTGGLTLGLSLFILSFVFSWLYNRKTKAKNLYRSKITGIIK